MAFLWRPVKVLRPTQKGRPVRAALSIYACCHGGGRRHERIELLPVAPVTMGYETISQSSSGQLSRLPSESSTWTVSPSMVQP